MLSGLIDSGMTSGHHHPIRSALAQGIAWGHTVTTTEARSQSYPDISVNIIRSSEQWTDVRLPLIVLGIFMDVVDSIEDRTYPNGCGDPRGRGTLAL
jgi:hypothetical protein